MKYCLISICTFFLLLMVVNVAGAVSTTVKHGDCTIKITAVNPFWSGLSARGETDIDTTQSRADIDAVKKALEKALMDSEDMRTKVQDACKKLMDLELPKEIDIMVFRDSAEVNYGNANRGTGAIRLDMGDLANIDNELAGFSQIAKDIVKSSMLTRVIAHEIDHLRHDPPDDSHTDPAGEKAASKTGECVDDENMVIAQMTDFGFNKRSFYAVISDGFNLTAYTVDIDNDGEVDTTVAWFSVSSSRVIDSSDVFNLSDDALDAVNSTWPAIEDRDEDLDGIPDTEDNCLHLVNPQQGPDCIPDTSDSCSIFDGEYDITCSQTADPFGIIQGNLGNPFNIRIEVKVDPETGEVEITTPNDLFSLSGQIANLGNGSCTADTSGSGMLGDPTGANIQIEGENWIFDIDENGQLILNGPLRFNFPQLLNNAQSSTADCTGEKTE